MSVLCCQHSSTRTELSHLSCQQNQPIRAIFVSALVSRVLVCVHLRDAHQLITILAVLCLCACHHGWQVRIFVKSSTCGATVFFVRLFALNKPVGIGCIVFCVI
jgi:hypothetical protein